MDVWLGSHSYKIFLILSIGLSNTIKKNIIIYNLIIFNSKWYF